MANDNTMMFSGDAADGIREMKDLLADTQTTIENAGDVLINFGEAAIEVAEGNLSPLVTMVEQLGEGLDTLAPLIAAVTAAFEAQGIVATVNTMMDAYYEIESKLIATEKEHSLQVLALNGTLAAKEVLVGLLSGKITLATAAQWLWNEAIVANPLGAVVTIAVAATAAIGAYCASVQQGTEEERAAAEAMERHRKKTEELRESYIDLQESTAEKTTADLAEIDNVKALYSQLEDLVDINGKVSDANKGRVDFILGELNEALGTEYELNGNQIKQYQEMKDSIENVILAKQAEIMLAGQEDLYREAIEKRAEAQEQALISKEEVYEQEQITEEKRQEYLKLNAEREAAIADGTFAIWSISQSQKVDEAQDALEREEKLLAEKEAVYNEDKAVLELYYNDIATYESAQTAFLGGQVDEAINILSKQNSGFQTATSVVKESKEEQKRILAEQYADCVKKLEAYAQEYEKGVEGYTQSGLDILIQQANDAKTEAEKVGLNITNGTIKGLESGEWNLKDTVTGMFGNVTKWAKDVLGIRSPSKVFAEIAKNTAAGFIQQIQRERTNVKQATEQMMEGTILSPKNLSSSLVQRMKNAVSSQIQLVCAPAQASAAQTTARLAYAYAGDTSQIGISHRVEIPVQLDGREIARATAEYTDGELEDIRRRKERGG